MKNIQFSIFCEFLKFRDEDDFDDRSMENNKFSSIMKEEARSARIGRQEDLEDMRRYVVVSFSRNFFLKRKKIQFSIFP